LKPPTATYRVQLNSAFTFADLKAVLPYLRDLGVSHVYASPIFQAKTKSTHGYDIVNPNVINPELGGREGFLDLMREVQACGLGWLQDIVPNHAAYSLQNPWIRNMLSHGTHSHFSGYFDIDWNYPNHRLQGKLLVPFLTEPLAKTLEEGKIRLVHNEEYRITYGELAFPLSPQTQHRLGKTPIPQTLQEYNQNPKLLSSLLQTQPYLLTYWKTALRHLNYRRFFDIIDLIGVRMENPPAFEDTHRLVLELAKQGCFLGLRVDHIDGLYDPAAYLEALRRRLPDAYLVVEKILTGDEQLPPSWQVEGTTGYDFLNQVNGVFIQAKNEAAIDGFYRQFTGDTQPFSETVYASKKAVLEASFRGDIENLARLLSQTLHQLGYRKPLGQGALYAAVEEMLACFPVYRSYLDSQTPNAEPFTAVLKSAQEKQPQIVGAFSALTWLFQKSANSPPALHALMRLQQFTGAIMAKGFEDTALYRYGKFLSLNEVGGDPAQFGTSTKQFHAFNKLRQQHWPLTLNASSTHDTKRGEDMRARLNVLSEIPAEFTASVQRWAELSKSLKQKVDGEPAPDRAEEYFLYQTLLGAYPTNPTAQQQFPSRIAAYMVKALREAKRHSNWLNPNLPYETAVTAFTNGLLSNHDFLEVFLPLQQKVAFYGVYNSLSQTLLKITCPGIPDFYQGSELWDLALVDPDNRRPIDYTQRQTLLKEVTQIQPSKVPNLLKNSADGKIKLYLIQRALRCRRELHAVFEEGEYVPLAVRGFCGGNVVLSAAAEEAVRVGFCFTYLLSS
jgi:(1->4)-alpha-D-glucan 1-alpha-D-glucosylmutase